MGTKIGQWKTGKMSNGLSLNFDCDTQIMGSEFVVNYRKARIHSALYQGSIALMCGGYFFGTLRAP